MTLFAVAFLGPLVGHRLAAPLGDGLALTLAGLTLALLRRRRTAAGFLALGLALYAIRGRQEALAPVVVPAGPVLVSGVVAAAPRVHPGGTATLRLESPPSLRLGFPPPPLRRGTVIRAEGRGDPDAGHIRVADPEALTVTRGPECLALGALAEELRELLRERLSRDLSPRAAGHLEALLLGTPLPAEDGDRHARTGTLHLFAVSGLHLAVLLSLLRWPLPGRTVPLLGMLFGYAALTGFRSPVSRALILAGAGLLGSRLGRPTRRGPLLLLAATIITAWDPAALESAGFQLSFSAYAGIAYLGNDPLPPAAQVLVHRLETRRWRRGLRQLGAALRVSTAAFLASAPVTVIWFRRLAPLAIPASVGLAPAIPVLLAASIGLAAFPGQPQLIAVVEALVAGVSTGAEALDRIEGASWTVARPAPGAWILCAGTFVVWILCHWGARRGVGRVRAASSARWLALAAVAGLPLWPDRQAGVYLLDARQGAALLLVADDAAILIDTGPAAARVTDQILDLGVRRLDLLVISHEHQDHCGGVPEVAARLAPRRIQRGAGRDPGLIRGADLSLGSLHLAILWPPEGLELGANDGSAVILARTPFGTVLTTGDLETRGTRAWMAEGEVPRCDILVAPHHGGQNQALLELLLEAEPARVWVPARSRQPAPETRLLLAAGGYQPELPDRAGSGPPRGPATSSAR